MSLEQSIKGNQRMKQMMIRLMIPKNQARPRCWVRWLLNPLKHKRGRGSLIRRNTRMDVFPWNPFVIGRDSTIEDFSTINNGVGGVYIGDRTRIGLGNTIIGPARIGNDIMFAQNIVLSGLNHGYEDLNLPPSLQKTSTAEIVVEDEVWIGANCVIVAGVTIGKHAVIAAGSVVTKSVPPRTVVAGNPARPIKQFNPATERWEKVLP